MFCVSEQMQVLLGLARKGDPELMQAFGVSLDDGENYNEDTFDNDFFVANVQSIVIDRIAASDNAGKGAH